MSRFLLVSILFMVVACQQPSPESRYVNDLVYIKNELQGKVESAESELKELASTKQYDRIVALAYRTQKMIRKKIDEVSHKPLPEEEEIEDFSYAVLRYFEYMKNTYVAYETWANAATEEERDDIQRTIDLLIEQRKEAEDEMNQSYKQYKKANSSGIMK
jgi:hypothetical protein